MPIYEYRCQSCGQLFEHLVLGSEEKTACPACGGGRLAKLMSANAAISSFEHSKDCDPGNCQDGGCQGCAGACGF